MRGLGEGGLRSPRPVLGSFPALPLSSLSPQGPEGPVTAPIFQGWGIHTRLVVLGWESVDC